MTNERTFRIIWPTGINGEGRDISASTISSWYKDAVADGELEDKDTCLTDPLEQALALHREGSITLHESVLAEPRP